MIMSKISCFSSLSQIFCESHFQKSKNNPVEVLTGGCPSGFSLGCLHIWGICLPPYGGTSAGGQSVNGRETHEGDIDLMGGGDLILIDYIIN